MENGPRGGEAPESKAEKEFREIVDEAVYWRDTKNTRDRLATPADCVGRALDNHGYRTRDQARNRMFGRVKAALQKRAVGDSPKLGAVRQVTPTRVQDREPSVRTNREEVPPTPVRPPSAEEQKEYEDELRRQDIRQRYRDAAAHEKRQPRDAYSVEDDAA